MNVPEEFTYVPAVPPTPVVVKRQAFELRNSLDTIDTTNTHFEFRINQRTFVDLKSFYLNFDLRLHILSTDAAVQAVFAAKFANFRNRLNIDGFHLFKEIVLRNESGTVIERLQEVGVLSEIYKSLFATPSYLDTHGQVFDSSSTGISHNYGYVKSDGTTSNAITSAYPSVSAGSDCLSAWNWDGAHILSKTYHCPVLKLLGFFQTGKVIRPSTFGGLAIEFILHSNFYEAIQLDNLAGGAKVADMQAEAQKIEKFSLSNVRLNFDECIVDSAYEQYYNDNYDTRGFRLDIETVDYTSSQLPTNTAMQSLRVLKIPFSVSNARALTSVIRPQSVMTTKGYRNTTFLPPSLTKPWRYQYVNMGGRYPLVPVESFTSNVQEVNKFKRHTQTLTQDTMYTLSNITRPFSIRGGVDTTAATGFPKSIYPLQRGSGGRFMLFAHLERVLNSRYTGIPLDANSLVLEVIMGNEMTDQNYYDVPFDADLGLHTVATFNNNQANFDTYRKVSYENSGYQVDSFVLYTSSVYVMNGQISVTK